MDGLSPGFKAGPSRRKDTALWPGDPEMAPQRLEKIESAPGNGMVPEDSNPQDVVQGRAARRARLRLTSRMTKSRSSPHACCERSPLSCSRWGQLGSCRETFPPCKPLKRPETGSCSGRTKTVATGGAGSGASPRLGRRAKEGNPSWRADPLGASSPEGKRRRYPRATRCALASQSLWLLRTCAGARRRSRTTSSAITWASAARPRRCSSCAWRTRGSGPG